VSFAPATLKLKSCSYVSKPSFSPHINTLRFPLELLPTAEELVCNLFLQLLAQFQVTIGYGLSKSPLNLLSVRMALIKSHESSPSRPKSCFESLGSGGPGVSPSPPGTSDILPSPLCVIVGAARAIKLLLSLCSPLFPSPLSEKPQLDDAVSKPSGAF